MPDTQNNDPYCRYSQKFRGHLLTTLSSCSKSITQVKGRLIESLMALKSPSCSRKRKSADFFNTTAQQKEMTSSWIKSWSKNICFWLPEQVLSTLVTLIETWQCKLITALFYSRLLSHLICKQALNNTSLPPSSGLEEPFQAPLAPWYSNPTTKENRSPCYCRIFSSQCFKAPGAKRW